jgi:hypothetical protein
LTGKNELLTSSHVLVQFVFLFSYFSSYWLKFKD